MMSLFIWDSDRAQRALNTYDPLHGTWMLNIIDPWPPKHGKAVFSPMHIVLFICFLFFPMPFACAVGSSIFGGKLFGMGSFTADIGIFSILAFLVIAASLIPIARRIFGDLINTLVERGTVDSGIRDFNPRTQSKGKVLGFFEYISRVDGHRGAIWFTIMVADQVIVYWLVILKDGIGTWNQSPVIPGSILHFFAVGQVQPNVAGLWAFLIWGPAILYLMIIIARVIVVYACLCRHIAGNNSLRIMPCHPDGRGGLSPIGQTSLFLSFFTFALGIGLAGITLNELVLLQASTLSSEPISKNLILLMVLWFFYFFFGTVLFLLPLLPLRRKMAAAKNTYLLESMTLYSKAEGRHRRDMREGKISTDTLESFVAIGTLHSAADKMAIWPFDTATILKYSGLIVSPLAPVLANLTPALLSWTKHYLGIL